MPLGLASRAAVSVPDCTTGLLAHEFQYGGGQELWDALSDHKPLYCSGIGTQMGG
jgi:hypothetical protein